MIILKNIDVDLFRTTHEIKKGIARCDAYPHVPDLDALEAEFRVA